MDKKKLELILGMIALVQSEDDAVDAFEEFDNLDPTGARVVELKLWVLEQISAL